MQDDMWIAYAWLLKFLWLKVGLLASLGRWFTFTIYIYLKEIIYLILKQVCNMDFIQLCFVCAHVCLSFPLPLIIVFCVFLYTHTHTCKVGLLIHKIIANHNSCLFFQRWFDKKVVALFVHIYGICNLSKNFIWHLLFW